MKPWLRLWRQPLLEMAPWQTEFDDCTRATWLDCLVRAKPPDGAMGTREKVVRALTPCRPAADTERAIDALLSAGWIEPGDDGVLRIPNWQRWQPGSDQDATNTERQARWRSRSKDVTDGVTRYVTRYVTDGVTEPETETETETEKEAKTDPLGAVAPLSPEPGTGKGEPGTALVKVQRAKHPPCPVREIIAAWGELVPTQPPVRTEHLDAWIAAHGENVRARWRESPQRQTLDYWRAYFEAISKCGWLSGQVEGSNGRCFVRGLEWFVGRKNMVRVESGEFFARENRLGVTEEQMREAKAKIRSKATWGEGGVDL